MCPSKCHKDYLEVDGDYAECYKCEWAGIFNYFIKGYKTISYGINHQFTQENLDQMDYCEQQLSDALGL